MSGRGFRRVRRPGLLVAAAAAALAVGCGSTVQAGRLGVTGGGLEPAAAGGALPTAGTGLPLTANGAAGSGTVPVTGPRVTVGQSTAPHSGTTSGVRPGVATPTVGKSATGVSARTISIGIQTFEGYNGAGNAFGVSAGLPTDETKANAQLVVDYINAHGGIAGREIVPVYHDTNIDSADSFDAQAQAACADFTEDHHVFAVVTPEVFDHDTLMSCLAHHSTPALVNSVNIYDQDYANRYPGLFYDVAAVFGDRWATFIDALVARGFFQANSKIGIIRATWPEDQHTAQVLTDALKAHGLSVTDEVAVNDETGTSDVAHTLSTRSSIQLRFRSEGIDHVIFEKGPVFPLGFMTSAESQGYRPYYALTSQANLKFLQANVSSQQLKKAAGITFDGLPSFPLKNAATALCQKIGPHVSNYCGPLLLLAAAVGKASSVDMAGLAAGSKALGTGFVSPQALATDFTRHYQDGGAAARTFGWGSDCSCFTYTGGVQRVP